MIQLWAPWIAAGVALLVALSTWRARRELARWLGRDPFARRRAVGAALFAVALLALAHAFRVASETPSALSGAGADVILAIDVSQSMDVSDAPPSRLRRAVRKAEQVALAADGVRLGLVVFAGEAFVALPLTQDRDALVTYLRSIDSDTVTVRGTDLARALRRAAHAFDPQSNRPRSVLLMTDGEHEGGSVEAPLAELRGLGARVIALGLGTAEGGVVPGTGSRSLTNAQGKAVVSQRDDALLRRISGSTSGRYLREFEDAPDASQLLPRPDERAASEVDDGRAPAAGWIALAVLALALELWLSSDRRRPDWPGLRRRLERWTRRRERVPARASVATVALALLLLALGTADLYDQGDALAEAGDSAAALSLYRRAEAVLGADPPSRIRVGNALYRLDRHEQSAGAFVDALRRMARDDRDARFVASFNLGNALLAQQRFEEARDAFWTAVLERPDDVEAKFNYEWAGAQRRDEPPTPPLPPPPDSADPDPDSESDSESSGGGGGDASGDAAPSGGSPQSGSMSEQQAERWLRSLQEPVGEALQKQITDEFEGRRRGHRGGQTW